MKSLFSKIIYAILLCTLTLSLCSCGEKPITIENCDAGHDMKQVSYTAPTCKTTGAKVFACTRCGYSETETLLTIPCDYQVKAATPSTCTTQGSQLLECSMCHTQKTETLPLIKHNYGAAVDTATCFTEGELKSSCSECGHEETGAATPMLAHDFGADGYCTKCGIYKTLFDVNDLNVSCERTAFSMGTSGAMQTYPVLLITGNLTAKFKNEAEIPYTYFLSHKVFLTTYLYDSSNHLLDFITAESFITTYKEQKALSVQYGGRDYTMFNQFYLEFHPQFADIKVFSAETIQNARSFKIEIFCEGYEKIEQSYKI